jgi:putative DNA primase/helicase
LLGVANGVYDLERDTFRKANPDDLMMMSTSVPWDPAAEAPRWEQCLSEWFPDPETRAYVQRLAGEALVGAQREHQFVIHYGPGANGKGTFVRAVMAVSILLVLIGFGLAAFLWFG